MVGLESYSVVYLHFISILLLLALTCSSHGFVLIHTSSPLRSHSSTFRPVNNNPLAAATTTTTSNTISPELVHDLDLLPLMQQVAGYTVTLRGRCALMRLVEEATPSTTTPWARSSSSGRQRRAQIQAAPSFCKSPLILTQASNASQARQAYEWAEQATLVLHPPSRHAVESLSLPPFYGPQQGPLDTQGNPTDTDDDEWLETSMMEWTLQDVIKAEKIIERLCQVHEWGRNASIATWVPYLADKATEIDVQSLQTIYQQIMHSVEIVRVKTATDPSGKASFAFCLSEKAFPVLGILRAKEAELQGKLKNTPNIQDRLDALREELQEKEASIQSGLCQAIVQGRAQIDAGLNIVAELDVWFAKAAFGVHQKASIPLVKDEGCISVSGFVHPLVTSTSSVVPVDLQLALPHSIVGAATTNSNARALVISGPNGGGKTLNLKSFGLVSQMVKLGIPIPIDQERETSRPRVGYFDDVITVLGDRQSVATGKSTFMAQLSSYADILEILQDGKKSSKSPSVLVLLDEFGSGTSDAEGGGAIAQAILEHLLQSSSCRIVATTHSVRLKTASFQDDRFACATVLLEETAAGLKKPSYRLEYGLIGESFPFEAARRSQPQLPESVLQRAAALCRPTEMKDKSLNEEKAYLAALTASLEKQNTMATASKKAADAYMQDMATCRAATIDLAKQYDRRLGFWEAQVMECYTKLRNDKQDSLELLGETLEEIRVTKKRVQTQVEMLRQRGLRLLPPDHVLTDGESVVIVGGTWEGTEGTIAVQSTIGTETTSNEEVWVSISSSPLEESQLVQLQRHQVAIWDYDSIFDNWEKDWETSPSREESKRRLNGILSTLTAASTDSPPSNNLLDNTTTGKSFTSSRQRRAAKKTRKKK